jgi:dihydropteroate synthase
VNDVSGGTHDSLMFETVGKLQVPMVIMHMRGNPETMQSMTQYECVVKEVSSSLLEQSKKAEEAGIPRWLQVLDPGIGFAKDLEHNLSLLKNSHQMRELVKECPLLLGPSRKGFIGKITGETKAEERDFGSLAACLAGLQSKDGKIAPTILRVHNVRGIKQGVQIFESILNANE